MYNELPDIDSLPVLTIDLNSSAEAYLEGFFAANSGWPENPYNAIDNQEAFDQWENGLRDGNAKLALDFNS